MVAILRLPVSLAVLVLFSSACSNICSEDPDSVFCNGTRIGQSQDEGLGSQDGDIVESCELGDAGRRCDGGLGICDATGVCVAVRDNDGDGYCVVGQDLNGDGACAGEAEFSAVGDCNDNNPQRSPGLQEQCDDGFDNDCDGRVDEDDADCAPDGEGDVGDSALNEDNDGDGFTERGEDLNGDGDSNDNGERGNAERIDCDDTRADINPEANEICDDNLDNDCDGAVDDLDTDCAASPQDTDNDGDGFTERGQDLNGDGDSLDPNETGADVRSDCDDSDRFKFPGAFWTEVNYGSGGTCFGGLFPRLRVSTCGCQVSLAPAMRDLTDGTGERVFASQVPPNWTSRLSRSSLDVTWSDNDATGDCDLDIRHSIDYAISVNTASKQLTVNFTNRFVSKNAQHDLEVGVQRLSAPATTGWWLRSGTQSGTASCNY